MQKSLRSKIFSGLGLLLLLAGFAAFYYFSSFLIYGGRFADDYYREFEPECNTWHNTEIFPDHRLPGEASSNITLRSCEESRALPRESFFVRTNEGQRLRMIAMDGVDSHPDWPIWLHVHGITDSYLNGLRFYDMAHRLHFKQVLIELQNHGGSSRHSQGSSWGCREHWDVKAALDEIQKRFPGRAILLSATSMGTLSSTEAALRHPESFASVKAIVYESALSSLPNLGERICLPSKWPSFCHFVWSNLVMDLSKFRSQQDFASCHRPDTEQTAIPTRLWISDQEYPSEAALNLALALPRHSQVSVTRFPRGTHSAYVSYQPEAVEADIAEFWATQRRP